MNQPEPVDVDVQDVLNVVLHGRYIKDFSFENPHAPVGPLSKDGLRLDVSVRVDVQQRRHLHEIVLTITATAVHDAEIIFLVELSYAGLFDLAELDDEVRQRFIFCEAPRILFPWADCIIAAAVLDGGLPPLILTPPDFARFYERERTASRGC